MKWGIIALLITLLIVITEPYRGINHSKINVYYIKQEYIEEVMDVYEAEEPEEDEAFAEYLKKKYFGESEDE